MPGAAATDIEAQDNSDDFTLKAHFAVTRFGQRPQPQMLIFRCALLHHGDSRLTEKSRKYPVIVDEDALRETVRVQIPAGFKVDELPSSVKIDSPFGKYEASWVSDGGAIVFQRAIEIPTQSVRRPAMGSCGCLWKRWEGRGMPRWC